MQHIISYLIQPTLFFSKEIWFLTQIHDLLKMKKKISHKLRLEMHTLFYIQASVDSVLLSLISEMWLHVGVSVLLFVPL